MQALSSHPVAKWLIIIIILSGIYFFHGFTLPVLAAMIIGFATWPIYEKLTIACNHKTLISASIMTTLITIIIVVPFLLLCNYLFTEAQIGITWIKMLNKLGAPTPNWIKNLPFVGTYLNDTWMQFLSMPYGLSDVTKNLGFGRMANIGTYALSIGKNIGAMALYMVFMLFTLFFFYKDGAKFGEQIDKVGETILPKRWNRISRVVPIMVSSTVTGMIIIAIGEGIVLGMCYWIAGAPNAVTLGILTGFFALIPGGAPLSMTLVSLYLVGSGSPINGMLLFIWGALELFIVDKSIRPRLVGGPAKLPFLPTFFGLVGGVKTLGIVGLFTGPVLMALIVALWREWLLDGEIEAKNEQKRIKDAIKQAEYESKTKKVAPKNIPNKFIFKRKFINQFQHDKPKSHIIIKQPPQ